MGIARQVRSDPDNADIVRRSIERSAAIHGIDAGLGRLPDRLTQTELRERRERMDDLLGDASRAVASMASLAECSKCVMLIAGADGVVVHRRGDGSDPARLGPALDAGSVWMEHIVGSNGVGTALVEEQPVTVYGSDHVLEILHPYSCTATPLWDAHRRVIGVLDLTTLAVAGTNTRLLRHLLEQTALAVHTALFARAYSEHCLVELSRDPLEPIRRSSALLAVAADGTIVGLTRPASRLLAAARTRATTPLGALVGDRIGVDLAALCSAEVGATATSPTWSLRVARKPPPHRAPRPRPVPKRPATPRRERLDLDALAGRDATMARHVHAIRRVLDTELPIMLGGETGTGKDALAKAIHAASRRASRPFVAVNCASLPVTLLDSELFGYAPGTFTGGLERGKRGKLEAAHRGTLFLDEIGDMPLPLQGRLLRVLAEREVIRIGAIDSVPVDIQLITATNRDLGALVEAGRFREDLYYRLRGATFLLPPLRARTDIRALVRRLAPPGVTFEEDALARLLAYRWPGNIRQLKQVLAFAAACSEAGRVTVEDLPAELREAAGEAPSRLGAARQGSERKALLQALGATGWNVSEAARRLGIGRSTAHRKIRQLGIHRPG